MIHGLRYLKSLGFVMVAGLYLFSVAGCGDDGSSGGDPGGSVNSGNNDSGNNDSGNNDAGNNDSVNNDSGNNDNVDDGSTKERAAASCKAIKDAGYSHGSGVYWVDPTGSPHDDAIPVYCEMDIQDGGWTMIYKISKDTVGDPYKIWTGPAMNYKDMDLLDVDPDPDNYVSPILAQYWGAYPFSRALVAIYEDGVLQQWMLYDVPKNDKVGWFSKSHLVGSSWTDLASESQHLFSIDGDNTSLRRWFIHKSYEGCDKDAGWLVVEASDRENQSNQCHWEAIHAPHVSILYSKSFRYQNWNTGDVSEADTFIVYVR